MIKTSAHHHRLNEVNSIQNIFAFLNDAVLAKENDLFERITLEINLFLYIQRNKTLCWIFTDLKLGKIGTSHGFILNPLIFVEQRGTSMRCMGGDFGRGRRNVVSRTNLIVQPFEKLTASCITRHTSVRCNLCLEFVYSAASMAVQWSKVLWLENPQQSCGDTGSLSGWKLLYAAWKQTVKCRFRQGHAFTMTIEHDSLWQISQIAKELLCRAVQRRTH